MYDSLLFLHFFGLSIGAGTSIYMFALSRHIDRHLDEAEARTLMPGLANAIATVGNIGFALLLVSGVFMSLIIGIENLNPMFWAKMLLVAAIVAFIAVMKYLSLQAQRKHSLTSARWIKRLSSFGPVLGILTIFSAVLSFH